jgi:hypothetical protein
MFQRDYILRLIEEFAKMIAAITGLKSKGELEEALKKVDEAYNELLEIEPKAIKSMTEHEFLEFLLNDKWYENRQLHMAAELLYQEGRLYVEQGDPVSARNVMLKARFLIEYLMQHDSTFGFDWYDKLHEMNHLLNGHI